ncbi:MAG: arginine--tRNA ligase [Gammaproteobacteria bacterium]|nr:arginine--tRNA ligase [Gammaproteobacteria bacterium]
MNPRALLTERFEAALEACGSDAPALVQSASKPEFGHYQTNGIMAAAKRMGTNPRDLAAKVVGQLAIADIAEGVEIAGPGFINITLSDAFLAEHLDVDAPLVQPNADVQRVVVDYSSPNLAKEMHVGHLRSTIIGDAIARVLEALGHTVVRQNHVGDWGTQFGMLLAYLRESGAESSLLSDLEEFYRAAKQRFDNDPEFAQRSRSMVVALQGGDADARTQWQHFIDISLAHCQAVYDRLGTTLTLADVRAESAYNDELPSIKDALAARGLLTESDGAQCVFLDEFKRKDGTPLPVIVQKSDGGYLYSTTDLAAIRYRADQLDIDRVLYFTDARQALHFRQIFAVAAKARFKPQSMSLEHMPFGNMLDKNGKPFKTRAGSVVKLTELLDEAEQRALALVEQKNPEIDTAEASRIAKAVGIGAVKYADLSKHRTSDYVFDWDLMLAFEGNTSPYLQYAFARIQSIFRRGEIDAERLTGKAMPVADVERDLAVVLLRFQEVLEQVAAEGLPHLLCGYLYELATKFTRFYEQCPILTAEGEAKQNRLRFSRRTARTLKQGLNLLGIETLDRM